MDVQLESGRDSQAALRVLVCQSSTRPVTLGELGLGISDWFRSKWHLHGERDSTATRNTVAACGRECDLMHRVDFTVGVVPLARVIDLHHPDQQQRRTAQMNVGASRSSR